MAIKKSPSSAKKSRRPASKTLGRGAMKSARGGGGLPFAKKYSPDA